MNKSTLVLAGLAALACVRAKPLPAPIPAVQLADGTWHVRRRAFPFQPTMNSGFPHGRDSWISAAATSWAVLALSVPEDDKAVVLAR